MEYNYLGDTGIKVSELCFGSLTLSSLQANLSMAESERLIKSALERGLNFIDTAEFYSNYHQLAAGLRGWTGDTVICTKSYAYDAAGARLSVEKALRQLNRDYIDIFCLHEQESMLTLQGHEQALTELARMKTEGKIRAIGISTHFIAGAEAALKHPLIEIVMTIANYQGLGIVDGNMENMLKAISRLKQAGKGVYGMKILGGGNMHQDVIRAFSYVKNIGLDSIAIGLQNKQELEFAVDFFCNEKINHHLVAALTKQPRQLHIASWCTGCGLCLEKCSQNALSLVDNQARIDPSRCILCSYCAGVCPDFCIKVF